MAESEISRAGLFFDELNKVRVLDPDVANQTSELKENCKDFVDRISEFQRIVGGFLQMINELGKRVEEEKMRAIGTRNLLKSMAKQREAQQQQLQALIAEKKTELERLRAQYDSLIKSENEQVEFIEQSVIQK